MGIIAISVVMPVYNTEKYVGEAIESILCQTFEDFEFIIVDDSSTDSSWRIIQKYAKEDNRIVAVQNTDKKGCYSARNFGLNLAKGKYYVVMDSDDIALPNKLQRQLNFMEQHTDIDIAGSWYECFGYRNGVIKTPLSHDEIESTLFFYNCISHPTVIMRKETLDNFDVKYDESFLFAQDYELWCREIDRLKFANIPQVLIKYRTYDRSIGYEKRDAIVNAALERIIIKNALKIGINLSSIEKEYFFKITSTNIVFSNIDEVKLSVALFDKIGAAGRKKYGDKFKDKTIHYFSTIFFKSVANGYTSLDLFFSFYKWGLLSSFRSKIRYLFYILK